MSVDARLSSSKDIDVLAVPQTINPPPQKGREIKVSKLSVKTLSTKNILQKDVNQDSEI